MRRYVITTQIKLNSLPFPNIFIKFNKIVYYIDLQKQMKKAKIFYYNFPTFKNKDEKLAKVKQTKFENIPFELINPDKNANWINQTDNDFDDLLPLCSKDVKLGRSEEAVFELYSFGVSTNRDEWVYDFDEETLKKKANFFIDKYNSLLNVLS